MKQHDTISELERKDFRWVESPFDKIKFLSLLEKLKKSKFSFGGNKNPEIDPAFFINSLLTNQSPKSTLPPSASGLIKLGRPIAREELLTGDIIFFKAWPNSKFVAHSAVYMGTKRFLFLSANGVVEASLDDPKYANLFLENRRFFTLISN